MNGGALKFSSDAQADRARPADDCIYLAAERGRIERIAADLLAALDTLRQLTAHVEQVLHIEIDGPGPGLDAGAKINFGIGVEIAVNVIDARTKVALSLALISDDALDIRRQRPARLGLLADL